MPMAPVLEDDNTRDMFVVTALVMVMASASPPMMFDSVVRVGVDRCGDIMVGGWLWLIGRIQSDTYINLPAFSRRRLER